MKALLLLLLAVPAKAHVDGPDHGLHHALPAIIGFLPLLKVMWDNWRSKFLSGVGLVFVASNAMAHGETGDPAWYSVGLNLVIIALLLRPKSTPIKHSHKHEHE